MRHCLTVSSVLLAAASGFSCGDDEPARRQAVFYLGLSTTQNASCSSADTFELPEGAQMTTTNVQGGGEGERIVDRGGNVVTCSVRETPGMAGSYQVDLSIGTQDTEIGYFSTSGVVSDAASDLDVRLQTTGFELEQEGCTATIEFATPGAVWLRDLYCPQLRDERTIGNLCTGRGALIFENCSR